MAAVRLGLLPLETLAKKVAACPAVQRQGSIKALA
jgi:hypothetical protein